MTDPTVDKTGAAAEVPDLKSLLAEHATSPTAFVTVPLNQALAAEITRLEAELAEIAEGATSKRMGTTSPLKAKAQEIEDARARMAASLVTFRFERLTPEARDQIRKDMGARDDPDEQNLRVNAAMCVEPKGATWELFAELRATLGLGLWSEIDEAANRAGGTLTVPFSFAASHILGTAK